jgi:hypothetical protein
MRLGVPSRTLLTTLTLIAVAATAAAQIWVGGYGRTPPRFPTATTFSGGFNFCRVMFTSTHREKQGWGTDYPGADINFSIRVAELTTIDVKMVEGGDGEGSEPDAVVVRLTDDALFNCPFLFMEDAGTARFSAAEVERLQNYLLKGGFLLVADYHGEYGREQFDYEIGRVLPSSRFPIVTLTPPSDHALWKGMFPVTQLPQMASIATWRRTGNIIERWNVNGDPPSARGIADEQGRVMVLMIHNTDLPDPWEREGEDKDYFYRFSPDAYAVGINILLYAMTH